MKVSFISFSCGNRAANEDFNIWDGDIFWVEDIFNFVIGLEAIKLGHMKINEYGIVVNILLLWDFINKVDSAIERGEFKVFKIIFENILYSKMVEDFIINIGDG